MSNLPCTNPNCRSYGKPHPNCQCGQKMAEGGDVSTDTPTWESTTQMADSTAPTWEDTTPVEASEEEPTWENTKGKFDDPLQQLGAGAEGIAKGFAGPLATLAEQGLSKIGVPGLTDEDIKGREEANPITHGLGEVAGLGAGLLTGTGEAALVGRIGSKAADLTQLANMSSLAAKVGSSALKGAIETGLIQFGDNISKALLGQGDPNDSVGSVLADGLGASSLLGGIVGGAGNLAGKALDTLGQASKGTYLHSFLSGIGEAAQGIDSKETYAKYLDPKAYDMGVKWWNNKILAASTAATLQAGYDIKKGWDNDDLEGGFEEAGKDLLKAAGLSLGVKALSGPASAVLLKALSDGEQNPRRIFSLIDYANKADSGAKKITKGIESLFKIGGQQALDKYDFETGRRKLDKYIEEGGIDNNINPSTNDENSEQNYAKGGKVESSSSSGVQHDDAIATTLPEQNILLNTAKGRISSYLSNLRPNANQPRLAFDAEPDQRPQKKSYDRALDIALHPLSILDKIKRGTIEPEHVKHLSALYPELTTLLQKKMTDKISDAQIKGEKPTYTIRQGMSLLMGTPLSGEMTPQSIRAAQAVFKPQQVPQQQGSPTKKSGGNASKISKSSQAFLTGNQSLVKRQQRVS